MIELQEKMLRKATAPYCRQQERPTQQRYAPRKQFSPIQEVVGEHKRDHKESHGAEYHQCFIAAHIPACPCIEPVKMENQQRQQRPDQGITRYEMPKMPCELRWLGRIEDIHVEKVPNHECKDQ